MNNVISIKDKLETWTLAFKNQTDDFIIFVSTHGRFKLVIGNNDKVILSTADSVEMLTSTSKILESALNVLFE